MYCRLYACRRRFNQFPAAAIAPVVNPVKRTHLDIENNTAGMHHLLRTLSLAASYQIEPRLKITTNTVVKEEVSSASGLVAYWL